MIKISIQFNFVKLNKIYVLQLKIFEQCLKILGPPENRFKKNVKMQIKKEPGIYRTHFQES